MRLIQYLEGDQRRVAAITDAGANQLRGTESVYQLALAAHAAGSGLARLAANRRSQVAVDVAALLAAGRVLAPLDHPDPAHFTVSGTGLNHLGSAMARDAMHTGKERQEKPESDSLRMFRLGVEGGKPAAGKIGAEPEWFYKGDGSAVVAPEATLPYPGFAGVGGEEAEVAALYVIAPDGTPLRVGFALGNEFSDHVLERKNYLYLAHSKLRACSFGPELLVAALPSDVTGTVRVIRSGNLLWEAQFKTGEANMSHTLSNMEHHHFKYPLFRRPGDVHCHFLGAAVLSFASGVSGEPGDRFEISAPEFGQSLRTTVGPRQRDELVRVTQL